MPTNRVLKESLSGAYWSFLAIGMPQVTPSMEQTWYDYLGQGSRQQFFQNKQNHLSRPKKNKKQQTTALAEVEQVQSKFCLDALMPGLSGNNS